MILRIFSFTILLALTTISVFGQFGGGDGSQGNPFQITNVDQLQLIEDYLDKHFVIVNDIDASETQNWNDGKGFKPIGTRNVGFYGTLDGQGFVISNLRINRPEENEVGIFSRGESSSSISNVNIEDSELNGRTRVAYLVANSYGIVKNINVTNSTIDAYATVGGVIGYARDGVLENIRFSGSVKSTMYSGGVIARTKSSVDKVQNIHFSGSIEGSWFIGGIIGESYSNISDCSSSGSLTTKDWGPNQPANFGGISGFFRYRELKGCSSDMTINTFGINTGGLIGNGDGATITNSSFTGSISGDVGVGGLQASVASGNTVLITNSFFAGDISGESLVGSILGEGSILSASSSVYTTSDVKSVGVGVDNTSKQISTSELLGFESRSTTLDFSIWDHRIDNYPILIKLKNASNYEITSIELTEDETAIFWNPHDLATKYNVQVSSNSFTDLHIDTVVTNNRLDITLIPFGVSEIRISPDNNAGIGELSEPYEFFLVEPVRQITLSSPSNESTGVTLTPTLSWSEDTNADSYRLQVSTDGFESFVVNVPLTRTSFTTPELGYNTEYSWRVRGTNSRGDGDWSETWSYTTQVKPVGQITLSSPSNESTGVTLTPTLSWNEDTNSDSYTLQVSTDEFESFVVNESLTETSFTTPELGYNTEYSWRVRGTNSSGDGDWSEKWSFTTLPLPPESITLSSPSNESTGVTVTPTLSWSEDTNAESYTIQVSNDGFEFIMNESVSDTTFTTSELEYNTEYSWRVRGTNSRGDGDWSEVWTFTTQYRQLSSSTPLNPQDGQDNVGTLTDFRWSEVDSLESYHLQVSTESSFSTLSFEFTELDSTSYTLTEPLEQNTQYYWRVRSLGEVEQQHSEWSDVLSFTTGVRTSVEEVLPTEYSLNQNYPNPFNPTTTITYSLPQSGMVTLNVYDITGRFITTLVDGVKGAGVHTVEFDANALSSGMYVYTLETDGYRQTRQMMLVK